MFDPSSPGQPLDNDPAPCLDFWGGGLGALMPFAFFVAATAALAWAGAPDEKGFWPLLTAALGLGLLLCRDRRAYCETVVKGMSRPIAAVMILAWTLSSALGILLTDAGLVKSLLHVGAQIEAGPRTSVMVVFLICCLISSATGTSFGTILICGPVLYPAGVQFGADPAIVAGALLGGATFGDSISPISDTTIASALSQDAEIGATVRSRLKYVAPAGLLALLLYVWTAPAGERAVAALGPTTDQNPAALTMLLVPLLVLFLLIRGRPLLEGLLVGLASGTLLGWGLGLLPTSRILSLDPERFTARSFIIDGIERGVGIVIFTLLLLGLIAVLEASGVLESLVVWAEKQTHGRAASEGWIVMATAAAVLLTTHSIVAILTVGEFVKRSGRRFAVSRFRRANLLDLTVVTFPFLLPYCIPVILTAAVVSSASPGQETPSPLAVGFSNFYSWCVLAVLVAALLGFGRSKASTGPLHES